MGAAALGCFVWNAQAIFKNPDQILKLIGVRALTAQVVSQFLDLPLQCIMLGAGRDRRSSRWRSGGKQLRRLGGGGGGGEHGGEGTGGGRRRVPGRRVNGSPE